MEREKKKEAGLEAGFWSSSERGGGHIFVAKKKEEPT